MYTFNLGLVFGEGEIVSIIVCNSENPIDQNMVNRVATEHFKIGVNTKKDVYEVLSFMIEGIKRECGINALIVNADVSCKIPKA